MQSRQIGASVLQLFPQREYELVVTDGGAEVDSHRQTTLIEAPRDGESGTPVTLKMPANGETEKSSAKCTAAGRSVLIVPMSGGG
ncbi:hypothetical protein ACN93_03895 [Gordonia paraffinivorans]|uniref:hypothetical protein n=1 Tax=Gordonia paraffinivorans TaxID=175628 RepID=UPI000D620F41|nr:hypothetical protein [Gordonia paraffinivorans]PWD44553.1 hypothetical protein ACN93_03895 [Gordonia paraffinivorans]